MAAHEPAAASAAPHRPRRALPTRGISRGVLRVSVDTSSHLFQLDRLLRSGLQRQIINQHPGKALRRIQLRVDTNAFTPDTRR